MWMCGLRVIYVLLAIEQAFFCRFSKPPRAGEVLPKFCTYSVVFLSEHQSWGSNPTPSPGSGWQVSPYGHPSTQHTWPGGHPQHGHPGLSSSPPPRPGYSYPYQSEPGQAMWAPWIGGSSPHPGGHSP